MGPEYDGKVRCCLARLRRVQDGTRWIQCTRSMGEPEIQKLKEMVDMIPPEDDFQNLKNHQNPQSFLLMMTVKENLKYLLTLKKNLMGEALVAFHQGPPSTSLIQIPVIQLVKYHWFLPPRTRSRRHGL